VKSRLLDQKAHWMLVANLSPALSMWLVAILIARSFGAEALGLFAFANAVVTPIMLVMQLPLRTLHITGQESGSDFQALLGLRLAMIAAGLTVIALACTLLSDSATAVAVMTAVAIYRACDSYCDLLHAGLQRSDQLGSIAFLVASRSLLVSTVALSCTMSHMSLEALTFAMAAISLITSIALDTRVCNQHTSIWPVKFGMEFVHSHAGRILPLSVTQGLNALSGNVPRYIVQAYGGSHMLGLYAVLEHVALATSMLVNALGQSMTAPLSRLWHAGRSEEFRHEAKRLLLGSIFVGGTMLAAVLLCAELLLELVYGPEFFPVKPFLGVASFTAMVMGGVSAIGYSLTAIGAFSEQAKLLLASTVASIIIGLLAVPAFGLSGLFLSLLLAATLQVAWGGHLLYARVKGAKGHV
jgi:O-antigen/teichoic acid export membrane protein